MRANMHTITKGLISAAVLAALAACGSGLNSTSSSSSGSGSGSGSGNGGGSNNTPPGIANAILFVPPTSGGDVIALQGTGGNTNAEVTFEVDDASGAGVAGIPVTFTLIPATGDATLTTATGTTDANGKASTFVVSGNVHFSVAVEAKVTTPSGVKTADSNALTISTGIPTEGNFGIAVSNLTANNAQDTLGITDTVTVQLSDRFSNPAPDGTAVSFQTNIGQIQAQCFTKGGSCSAVWTSSGLPATANGKFEEQGQAEIFAYTVGEESFTDVDGDGVFDHSDTFSSGGTDSFSVPSDPSADDIGEVYLDGNPTASGGAYNSGDAFFDFNKDGVRNPPDGKFYGFGCKGTATVPCGSKSTIGIGKQICVLMSTSGAKIVISPSVALTGANSDTISAGANPTVKYTVSDLNGHALASGTSVTLVTANLSGATVTAPPSLPFTYGDDGCGSTPISFTVSIAPATGGTTPAGSMQLIIKTPGTGGAETDSFPINIGP